MPSFILAFDVGGLGFEFCVFVAGWRHALRSEWPFIIIITGISIISINVLLLLLLFINNNTTAAQHAHIHM